MTAPLPKRSHRRGATLLSALVVGVGLAVGATASAQSGSISGQMEAVRQLEVEIAGYDARFTQAVAAHEAARQKLAAVRARIAHNTQELVKTRKRERSAQNVLGLRISMIYRQPEPTQIELLLRSTSFSDAVSGAQAMQRMRKNDTVIVDELAAAKERIKTTRIQLVDDQKEAKVQSAETRRQVVEIDSIRSQRRAVLMSAQRQLAVMIAAEQARRANAARLAALRSAQRRVVQRTRADGTTQTTVIQDPTPTPVSTDPAPSAAPAPSSAAPSDALQAIAQCESGGNPAAVSPSGLYRGKYQFDPGTWSSLGGQGSDPAKASEAEQDRVAGVLYSQQGASPWPVCGR